MDEQKYNKLLYILVCYKLGIEQEKKVKNTEEVAQNIIDLFTSEDKLI